MPTVVKLVLGAMTLWGAVYAIAALVGDFALVPPPGSERVAPSGLEAFVIHVNAANALVIFLILSGIALSLHSLPVRSRCLWVAAFAFFYPITLPAFLYLHIWRTPPRAAPSPAAPDDP